MSNLPEMVLRTNGYTIAEPDAAGLVVMTRDVFSLRTGATYKFRIERVGDSDEATLIVTNGDREVVRKESDWLDIASDGVAVAHGVANA